jgi:hypothetical protein
VIFSARALALGAALLWSASALAAEWSDDALAPGHASAQSFRPMQGAVAVVPLDNSTLNLALVEPFAEVLRRRGFTVADDALLLLEFETLTESGAPAGRRGALQPTPRVDIGRERDNGRSDAINTRVDVFSNAGNSVVTGVRPAAFFVRYSLRATVSERNGARLWEGYIQYSEIVNDETRLYASMASLLAEMVGTTGEGRFRID